MNSREIEERIRDLVCGHLSTTRQNAARELGEMRESSARIVAALQIALADSHPGVKSTASRALLAEPHRSIREAKPAAVAEATAVIRREAERRKQTEQRDERASQVAGWRRRVTLILGLLGLAAIWNAIIECLEWGRSSAEELLVGGIGLALLAGAWGLRHQKNWARIVVIITTGTAALVGLFLRGFGLVLLLGSGYVIYWFAAHGECFD